jgi:hypothetical protein
MQWRSAEHYRKRAEELRIAAGHTEDQPARETLLDLAEQYEMMADKRGEKGKPDGRSKSGHSKSGGQPL